VRERSEIRVNLPFRGRQLAEFLAIKEHLGIQTNADVVRYLVRRHARALQRQRGRATREGRRGDHGAPARGAPPREAQAGGAAGSAPPQAGDEPELICLDCTLPECDERDPRCLYRRALGAQRG
jgi:hypothetical protein